MKKVRFDEKEFEEFRKRNFEERLRFIDIWANYIKNHANSVWSKQQKDVIDSAIQGWGKMTPEILFDMQSERKSKKMGKVENRIKMQRSKVR